VVRFAETVDELLKDDQDRGAAAMPDDQPEIDDPESRANQSDDGPGPGEAGGEGD